MSSFQCHSISKGLKIVCDRQALGSLSKWGSHVLPNLGQILGTFQLPLEKFRGRSGNFSHGKYCPMGLYQLTPTPIPLYPPLFKKKFEGWPNFERLTLNSQKSNSLTPIFWPSRWQVKPWNFQEYLTTRLWDTVIYSFRNCHLGRSDARALPYKLKTGWT